MQKIGSTKRKFQVATAEISYFDTFRLDFFRQTFEILGSAKIDFVSGLEISFQLIS